MLFSQITKKVLKSSIKHEAPICEVGAASIWQDEFLASHPTEYIVNVLEGSRTITKFYVSIFNILGAYSIVDLPTTKFNRS